MNHFCHATYVVNKTDQQGMRQ